MQLINKLRLLFCIVLAEYLIFFFSGVSFASLHGDNFFSIEADPAFWIFYLARIPQFIVTHQWLGILLDISVLFSFFLLIRNPLANKLAIILFLLLLLYYVTLMGYLTHRNYQTGFFMLFISFCFKKKYNRAMAFEATRYFLLFFYCSAALLKVYNHAFTDIHHFSHLVTAQFTPYFLEGNTGIRTNFNLYLISHPVASYTLFIASFVIECITLVGFFTKRFDKWLAVLLLLFHFSNWFVMDIGVTGQIGFICLLFLSNELGEKKKKKNCIADQTAVI